MIMNDNSRKSLRVDISDVALLEYLVECNVRNSRSEHDFRDPFEVSSSPSNCDTGHLVEPEQETAVERWEPGEICQSRNKCTAGPHQKKRGPRPKVLSPAEKRQKRLDANDRERERMGKLNCAFDSLRHLLPKHGNDRELSKFETIQIAKNYIKALNRMLEEDEATSQNSARHY